MLVRIEPQDTNYDLEEALELDAALVGEYLGELVVRMTIDVTKNKISW